jgi:hypothetical protein
MLNGLDTSWPLRYTETYLMESSIQPYFFGLNAMKSQTTNHQAALSLGPSDGSFYRRGMAHGMRKLERLRGGKFVQVGCSIPLRSRDLDSSDILLSSVYFASTALFTISFSIGLDHLGQYTVFFFLYFVHEGVYLSVLQVMKEFLDTMDVSLVGLV